MIQRQKIPKELLHEFIDTLYDDSTTLVAIDDFQRHPSISEESIDIKRKIVWTSYGISNQEEANNFVKTLAEADRNRVLWRERLSGALLDMAMVIFSINRGTSPYWEESYESVSPRPE